MSQTQRSVTTLDDAPKANAGAAVSKVAAEKVQELKPVQGGDFCGRKSRIMIANSPGEGGKDAVFVGVQGVPFQIPRNKTWEVPIEVANVLTDAVETSYSRNDRTGESEASESPRFSFTRIDLEQPAEAAA